MSLAEKNHLSSGVTPAFLMFGRELKTKLPELRRAGNLLDEGGQRSRLESQVHLQGTG